MRAETLISDSVARSAVEHGRATRGTPDGAAPPFFIGAAGCSSAHRGAARTRASLHRSSNIPNRIAKTPPGIEWNQDQAMVTTAATDRIIRINTVLDKTGLSRSTLYRKMQAGTFPRQVRLAARCTGWRESAVNAWMRNPIFYAEDDHLA